MGELSVTHLAIMAPRLTEANFDKIVQGVKGKSKREAEAFVSRISLDGSILEKEPIIEVRFRCSKDLEKKLKRALEISPVQKGESKISTVIERAIELFLDKNDPLIKAERAIKRREKKENLEAIDDEAFIDAVEDKRPFPQPLSTKDNDECSNLFTENFHYEKNLVETQTREAHLPGEIENEKEPCLSDKSICEKKEPALHEKSENREAHLQGEIENEKEPYLSDKNICDKKDSLAHQENSNRTFHLPGEMKKIKNSYFSTEDDKDLKRYIPAHIRHQVMK